MYGNLLKSGKLCYEFVCNKLINVSFLRTKFVEHIWLVLAAALLFLFISASAFTRYDRNRSVDYVANLRRDLINAKQDERVLNWLFHDQKREFDSLQQYETVHFSKDIKQQRTIRRYNNTNDALKDFQNCVTIIIYSQSETLHCINNQIQSIRRSLPRIRVEIVSSVELEKHFDDNVHVIDIPGSTEGQALNTMAKLVRTEYLLYLSEGAELSDFNSNHSPWLLLQAHRQYPEFDIIGGSVLRVNDTKREVTIPCYRIQTCNWVIKQSPQCKYTVDDILTCEETATAFMAKRARLLSLGQFDESLKYLTTTDFFYRAKSQGALVGVRPNVLFRSNHLCTNSFLDKSVFTELYKPFLNKYDLIEYRAASGDVTVLPDIRLALSAYQWFVKLTHPNHVKGGVMSARVLDALLEMLINLDFFFKKQKSVYVIEGGGTMASIKMRRVLPYDASIDIDIRYYAPWRKTYEAYLRHSREHTPHYSVSNVFWTGRNEIIVFDRNNLVATSLVCHWGEPDFSIHPHQILMVPLSGRFFPADRRFFRINRSYYGVNYLSMKGHDLETMYCSVPGHHACVSKYYVHGAGHWTDFECQL